MFGTASVENYLLSIKKLLSLCNMLRLLIPCTVLFG